MCKCKSCGKEMELTKNGKRNLFDDNTWIYECMNEDCMKPSKVTIDVCEECENETWMWE